MADQGVCSTPILRYYIDTRLLASVNDGTHLPLLSTLPQEIQAAVTRFFRVEDKLMSLASALLKFTFIHRSAKLRWNEVQISKTPKPHGRPYWNPPSEWDGDGLKSLEFNVSHQAGIVILAGCRAPSRPEMSLNVDKGGRLLAINDPHQQPRQVRIGVDVACTNESRRTPDLSTQAKLDEWVDTFSEAFSIRERKDMKVRPVPNSADSTSLDPVQQTLNQKGRRFYTYWALKEAYIKMVGEGLLADWLRQLEFVNVTSPDPGERLTGDEAMIQVLFKGNDISDSVEIELEGFEDIFLFTMISTGIAEQRKEMARWVPLDIEMDIRPCAEGTCSCLN